MIDFQNNSCEISLYKVYYLNSIGYRVLFLYFIYILYTIGRVILVSHIYLNLPAPSPTHTHQPNHNHTFFLTCTRVNKKYVGLKWSEINLNFSFENNDSFFGVPSFKVVMYINVCLYIYIYLGVA